MGDKNTQPLEQIVSTQDVNFPQADINRTEKDFSEKHPKLTNWMYAAYGAGYAGFTCYCIKNTDMPLFIVGSYFAVAGLLTLYNMVSNEKKFNDTMEQIVS